MAHFVSGKLGVGGKPPEHIRKKIPVSLLVNILIISCD